MRIGDAVLKTAGSLPPATLSSLDAIHLATASLLHTSLGVVVTYDARMADAALTLGMDVRSPGR